MARWQPSRSCLREPGDRKGSDGLNPIVLAALAVAVIVGLVFTVAPFTRRPAWRATVTPLASIIGSGFLVSGPLLAREFGSAAAGAMLVLLLIAYAVGAVVRFNIRHTEAIEPRLARSDPMMVTMRAGQLLLALAYAVSVAFYLKLLAEFILTGLSFGEAGRAFTANAIVTAIVVAMAALALRGSLKRIEDAAHLTVGIKLGTIAGMLAGLGLWWAGHAATPLDLPPARVGLASVPLLLGLLITVQGFETSRYLGASFDADTRIATMRRAQWLSSAIYLAFVVLLTPFLRPAAAAEGVAGILGIMELVAPLLGLFVLTAAVFSQLSAAIADSIGAGGLMTEVSRGRLGPLRGFLLAAGLSIVVVWLTDPFQVIALASRAFALFYAVQAALALWVARRTGVGGPVMQAGAAAVVLVCLVAASAGAPAEG